MAMEDPEPPKVGTGGMCYWDWADLAASLILSLPTGIYLVSATVLKSKSLPFAFKCNFKVK